MSKKVKNFLEEIDLNKIITNVATKKETDDLNSNKIFDFKNYNPINNKFQNILKTHQKEKSKIIRKNKIKKGN